MEELETLTRCEEEILQMLLLLTTQGRQCVRIGEIIDRFKDTNWWKRQTVNTFLLSLCDKGYVKTSKIGRITYYYPLVSKEEYLKKNLIRIRGWFTSTGEMLDFIETNCLDK